MPARCGRRSSTWSGCAADSRPNLDFRRLDQLLELLDPTSPARILCRRRATVRGVSTETAARLRPLRLTQARIGDTLHDGNGTRVAIVNAFTTVNPETEATVRAVDYQVIGAAAEQFRVYSDDANDVARWRVETPESP